LQTSPRTIASITLEGNAWTIVFDQSLWMTCSIVLITSVLVAARVTPAARLCEIDHSQPDE